MSKTLVIADDDDNLRIIGKVVATRAGYTILGEARDGNELVALVQQHNPSTILTDIEMPGKNGLEALAKLRAQGYNNPVVINSGQADVVAMRDRNWQEQKIEVWYHAQLQAFLLQKPYGLADLREALEKATAPQV